MMHLDSPASPGSRRLAALALFVAVALLGFSIAAGSWNDEHAPFPFAWRDVAMVHVICAIPLAGLSAAALRRRLRSSGLIALAIVLLGVGILPFVEAVRANLGPALLAYAAFGIILRAASALGLTLSAYLLAVVLIGGRPPRNENRGWRFAAVVAGLGTVVLLLPPALYVRARCRHDVGTLGELLAQSRFGEARALTQALLVLDPRGQWNGQPLTVAAVKIDRVVREIESRTLSPLPFHASANERLDRARRLAMLGRTEAALEVLQSLAEPALAAEVESLRGAIYENGSDWELALASYQNASAAWDARPPSPAREAGRSRASTGTAYCQRKLGRYAEAEASYLQALKISPTADTHFLLAQFYEDAQQAEKARTHARHAIALSPAQYRQKGENLIRKLTVFHFGCLGIFSSERSVSNRASFAGSHYANSQERD